MASPAALLFPVPLTNKLGSAREIVPSSLSPSCLQSVLCLCHSPLAVWSGCLLPGFCKLLCKSACSQPCKSPAHSRRCGQASGAVPLKLARLPQLASAAASNVQCIWLMGSAAHMAGFHGPHLPYLS